MPQNTPRGLPAAEVRAQAEGAAGQDDAGDALPGDTAWRETPSRLIVTGVGGSGRILSLPKGSRKGAISGHLHQMRGERGTGRVENGEGSSSAETPPHQVDEEVGGGERLSPMPAPS